MEDLSLSVLDIAQNSLAAGARHLRIEVLEFPARDLLEIIIKDDGRGMRKELLEKVTDPFVTTRTTRKVGLGIPLLKMTAEMAGGSFFDESEPVVGTRVESHIDIRISTGRLGNMAEPLRYHFRGNLKYHCCYKSGGTGSSNSIRRPFPRRSGMFP